MINCPGCGKPYRIITSRPLAAEVREYSCHCRHCDARFRQYGVFEGFIVENEECQPPSEELQPSVAKQRMTLLKAIGLIKDEEEREPIGMVFVNGR